MEGEALDQAKMSFREQKAAELAAERGENAERPEKQPLPREPEGSTHEEEVAENVEDGDNVGEESQEDTPIDESELEEESTEDYEADEDETEGTDYKAKYEELQKEHSRVTENRKRIESDLADSMASVIEMKHSVTESLDKARRGAEYYANLANQQAQAAANINWAAVPPEQVPQLQQQAQQAMLNAQQQNAQFEQFERYETSQREELKRQEAEVSLARLKAAIPEWGDQHYSELGALAGEYGFDRKEFADITDYRLMLALHDVWKSRQAVKTVEKTVKQRKANPPRSRSGKTQARNSQGKFVKAQENFRNSPNTRGAFQAMKVAELQKNRR